MKQRVLVADGAMGTMIQNSNVLLEDFKNLEGCNEILNRTRPDLIEEIHLEYFHSGSDAVETNSFGCNFANLMEYGIQEQIFDLSLKSAEIARKAADQFEDDKFVLGSIGPGTKLPTLGHEKFDTLRIAYKENAKGLIAGGADALLVETAQDLLQAKSAVIGAQEAMESMQVNIPIFVSITVEQNGTMLLGSEVGAATAALTSLGIDGIGLNCATGPEEMSEHLRFLSQNVLSNISCMPNAGLPILENGKAVYPLSPKPFANYLESFIKSFGLSIIGGCCGTTPEHILELKKLDLSKIPKGKSNPEEAISSLYHSTTIRQDRTYLTIGERANANGSRRFKDALINGNYEECVAIATNQVRDGAHVLDLCVDYVGRDGVKDMVEISSRLATASTLPIMLDSTEPKVIEAGLKHLGGRCLVNSVNFEDGDGPDSRFVQIRDLAKKYGAAVVALTIDEQGQARTADWKFAIAERLISNLEQVGFDQGSILIDALTFPIATGQEETRKDGLETLLAIRRIKEFYPNVRTILGLSNISFGLNAAARQALNSVFLKEAIDVGLDSAIVDAAKIIPLNKISEENLIHLQNLIYDRRTYDESGLCTYDPLTEVLRAYSDVKTMGSAQNVLEELKALPIKDNLRKRIIDGISKNLEEDLDLALLNHDPLEIVNSILLSAMKEVGDLFGSGVMQLPFVLQSAETMKLAVAYLEQFMEKVTESGKGKILLATVKGDVHDIGKNLVDIILTNNGYTVINIGIKQTIQQIIDAAIENNVDVIGMSGLLVKSTVIMRENLEELNQRGLSERFPVILGGAALTRTYVEDDLANLYQGTVRYAKDAFEGLNLVEALLQLKNEGVDKLPPLKKRIHRTVSTNDPESADLRSNVSTTNNVPNVPFIGNRIIKGISLNEVASWLDERATFVGQWGLKPGKLSDESLEELIDREGRPRLRYWLDQIQIHGLNEFAVSYGYFPAYSSGNTIFIQDEKRVKVIATFEFPRQRTGERLCLADYVKPKNTEPDFVGFHVVTMGNAISDFTSRLFQANKYREYLELHGLSVQLTEALAEMWHARIRDELGIGFQDGKTLASILKQEYQGERYSFGYPACPDLELQEPLVQLLEIDKIGVNLSEEFQLHPEQSTSAIIFHHPEARYFNAR